MHLKERNSRVVIGTGVATVAGIALLVWAMQPNYDGVRHLRYSFTVQNTSAEAIEKAEFTTFAPIPSSATQSLTEIKATTPFEAMDDQYGNRKLRMKMGALPAYATKTVTIDAWVKTATKPNRGFLGSKENFLKPETGIEVDAPEIQKQAKDLAKGGDATTALNTAKWVENNVRYSSPERETLGALYALRERKGDCTEFASLTTALARANQIPARTMTGFVVPENAVLRPHGLHNWTELHTGSRWHIADPQNRRYDEKPDWYVAFRIEGSPDLPKEFASSEIKNLSVKMN